MRDLTFNAPIEKVCQPRPQHDFHLSFAGGQEVLLEKTLKDR